MSTHHKLSLRAHYRNIAKDEHDPFYKLEERDQDYMRCVRILEWIIIALLVTWVLTWILV